MSSILLSIACCFNVISLTQTNSNGISPIVPTIKSSTEWQWEAQKANLLYCFARVPDEYDIAIHGQRTDDGLTLNMWAEISKDSKLLARFDCHSKTVFIIRSHFLTYIDPRSSGDVVRIDLSSGKEIWRSKLNKGVGEMEGIHAFASFILECQNDDTVVIRGWENTGRFLETKRAESGETTSVISYLNPSETPGIARWRQLREQSDLGNLFMTGTMFDRYYSMRELEKHKATDTLVLGLYEEDYSFRFAVLETINRLADPQAIDAMSDVLAWYNASGYELEWRFRPDVKADFVMQLITSIEKLAGISMEIADVRDCARVDTAIKAFKEKWKAACAHGVE